MAALALAMGLRHGTDVDHIATIDGLTRARGLRRDQGASRCGLFFSTGHGLVVACVATALAIVGGFASPPEWLRVAGVWNAVSALMILGLLNLRIVWKHQRGGSAKPVSVGRWLVGRLSRLQPESAVTPAGSIACGALFALSFDAFAAAALMATSAIHAGALWVAPLLAMIFLSGMALVDGLVGWCSVWLLRRAHARSPRAPTFSAFAISLGCIVTAATLILEPRQTVESKTWALSASALVWAIVPLSYLLAWVFKGSDGESKRFATPVGEGSVDA